MKIQVKCRYKSGANAITNTDTNIDANTDEAAMQ